MKFKMLVKTNYRGKLLSAGEQYESGKLSIPDEIIRRWQTRKICRVESPEIPELLIINAGKADAKDQIKKAEAVNQSKSKTERHGTDLKQVPKNNRDLR